MTSALLRADLDEALAVTEDVWRSLGGARIFLTGGTGFFGVWLVSLFAHARARLGHDVGLTILTRDAARARAQHGAILEAAGAAIVTGDARSFAFPSGPFTHVIHGAFGSSTSPAPREAFDVIVDGTRHTLDFAEASGAKRFFFISSGAVYGVQRTPHVAEDAETGPNVLDPANAYAEGKRAAELLVAMSSREITIARGFAYVAPYLPLDVHFAIGNFLRDAMRGQPIRILGDGTPYRSYMYGSDLAAWLWTILARGRDRVAYNVGSEDGRPLRAIAERVAALTGVPVHVAKTPPEGQVPSRYVPSTARARSELGLALTVDLDEALRRTLAFHKGTRSPSPRGRAAP
jgi:nucleoside-diphosphate-sugar epimerase